MCHVIQVNYSIQQNNINCDIVDTLIVHTHIVVTKFKAALKRNLIWYITMAESEILPKW